MKDGTKMEEIAFLSHCRQLQNWGGLPKEKGMIAEPIPSWLQDQIDKIQDLGVFPTGQKPNHILINEYKPGQGISPHLDGNLFHPIIATISLKSHCVLNYYEPLEDPNAPCSSLESRLKFKLYIPQRSLLLVKDKMFHHYLHGIEEINCDIRDNDLIIPDVIDANDLTLERKTRISLTIRHVPNTKKIKIRL